jgi:deazaflavin-dependent oxidoreductase (nitroreductase family)
MFAASFNFFVRVQIAVFRLTHGRVMSNLRGMPVLLLTTLGRRSGRRRTTPLMYLRDGEDFVIIASNLGRPHHPAWFHNLQASPWVEIEVPGKRLPVTATVTSASERERLWSELIHQAPFFDDYRKSTTRPIPMIRLTPRAPAA